MIFDILGELGSGAPWLYRVWGVVFSKTYRESVRSEYKKMAPFFRAIDITLSALCFVGEVILLIYILSFAAGNG
jgi:hypothetical protein